MNNTFNYSFLIDKDFGEIRKQIYFIPSEIISEKYTTKEALDISNLSSKTSNVSTMKNS